MQKLEIIEVQSKMLRTIIWDSAKNVLMVKFVDSPIYIYPDAPHSAFEALKAAESKGKAFAQIKKQYPRFVRLDN